MTSTIKETCDDTAEQHSSHTHAGTHTYNTHTHTHTHTYTHTHTHTHIYTYILKRNEGHNNFYSVNYSFLYF